MNFYKYGIGVSCLLLGILSWYVMIMEDTKMTMEFLAHQNAVMLVALGYLISKVKI